MDDYTYLFTIDQLKECIKILKDYKSKYYNIKEFSAYNCIIDSYYKMIRLHKDPFYICLKEKENKIITNYLIENKDLISSFIKKRNISFDYYKNICIKNEEKNEIGYMMKNYLYQSESMHHISDIRRLEPFGGYLFMKEYNNFKEFCLDKNMYIPINLINYFDKFIRFRSENAMDNSAFTRWPDDVLILKSCNCVDFSLFVHYLYEEYKKYSGYIDNSIGFIFLMENKIVDSDENAIPVMFGHAFPMIKIDMYGEAKVYIIDYGSIANYSLKTRYNSMIYGEFDSYEEALDSYIKYIELIMNKSNNDIVKMLRTYPRRESIILYNHEMRIFDKYYDNNISQFDLITKSIKMKKFMEAMGNDKRKTLATRGFMEFPGNFINSSGFSKFIKQDRKKLTRDLLNIFKY